MISVNEKNIFSPPRHILVTGARGAIGRQVVRIAKARGNVVTGIGHGQWSGDHELPSIDGWLNGDVSTVNISELFKYHGLPDAIIHLAGGSHVGNSIEQPTEDFQRTVLSAQRLLEWVRTSSPNTKIVIASSAAVYGIGHEGPIIESADCEPHSPYGTHKAMVETMAKGYATQFGLNTTILRLFSVYGPGLRKQLIWEVTNRLLRGERRMTLSGTGDERRDFVEVSDAARMLLEAINLSGLKSIVLNCCSGKFISVRDVTLEFVKHFPDAAFSFSAQTRPGDPASLVGDPSLATATGISTSIKFSDGLAGTIVWAKSVQS
jgi:UDP-glucose 4-epimerase